MGFYRPGIYVDSFDTDADGFIRAHRDGVCCPVEIGGIVSVDSDELGTFARVVRIEGSFVYLRELTVDEREQAAKDLELSFDDWCDPLDE